MDISAAARAYLSYLSSEQCASANTLRAYARDLRQFADFLRQRGASFAPQNSALVEAFLAEQRERGRSQATCLRRLSCLRGLYRFLVVEGEAASEAASMVPRGRLRTRLPHALEPDEVKRLLEAAGTSQ